MPKPTGKWILFQYVNNRAPVPLSKPFKSKQLAEKARAKYPERERKQMGISVIEIKF
jgi:hypothetical protein